MPGKGAAGVSVGAGFVVGAAAGGCELSAPGALQNVMADLMRQDFKKKEVG